MSGNLLMVAAWVAAAGAVTIIALGIYAITLDRPEDHPQTNYIESPLSVCIPSRARMLTGANLDLQQLIAIQQDSEELQRQAAEIERLQAVIRQRNRTIKRLRAEQQQAEQQQPVTASSSVDRFEWLEIRGQS